MKIINSFSGKDFTEKLVNTILSANDRTEKCIDNTVSDRNKEVSDNVRTTNLKLNMGQEKFLIDFLHLYEGSFRKFWVKDEDKDQLVGYFIRNILYSLGDDRFPVDQEILDANNIDDISDLIKR